MSFNVLKVVSYHSLFDKKKGNEFHRHLIEMACTYVGTSISIV